MKRRQFVLAPLALGAAALARAQHGYPSRPIRLVVSEGPGTSFDATARYVGQFLQREWGQPVVVENKVGSGGNVAAEAVARAPADGYTMLIAGTPFFINKTLFPTLPFDPVKDFRPIAGIGAIYLLVVVPAASPFNTLKELLDFGRANPGKLAYASAGNGSTTHFGPAWLFLQEGVQARHIPYKGLGQALIDTGSGLTDVLFSSVGPALAQVAAGRIKVLGATSLKRMAKFPNVPAVAEMVPGYEMASRLALVAPAGVTDQIASAWGQAVEKMGATPEFSTFIANAGMEPDIMGLRAYSTFAAGEFESWARKVKALGIKIG